MLELKLVLLLFVANGAPILAKRWLGARMAWPLDGHLRFIDGRPLLGLTKTLRGVVAAVAACLLAASLLGFPMGLGLAVGALSMIGDLLGSFIKRRLGLPSSSCALGLDQIPESLLPVVFCRSFLGMDWVSVLSVVAVFFAGGLAVSRILFALHIRDRPC